MAKRNYRAGVRAALISFSAGSCYWPDCRRRLLSNVGGEYFIDLDIAHICALEEGGPRYESNMTDRQRNDLPNVIFLCRPHHKAVDANNGKDYSTKTLRMWKTQRETSAQASLSAEVPVTAELMEQLINRAMVERSVRIEQTLARLEQNDAESALVMRELLGELKLVRRNGSLVDPDSAAMLSNAARKLVALADWATTLDTAADKLTKADGLVNALDAATERLIRVQGMM